MTGLPRNVYVERALEETKQIIDRRGSFEVRPTPARTNLRGRLPEARIIGVMSLANKIETGK